MVGKVPNGCSEPISIPDLLFAPLLYVVPNDETPRAEPANPLLAYAAGCDPSNNRRLYRTIAAN
jgi:hypothetical protein